MIKKVYAQPAASRLPKQAVCMKARPEHTVTCPHCWTDQRAERAVCYRCGARFIYLDEAEQEASKGA